MSIPQAQLENMLEGFHKNVRILANELLTVRELLIALMEQADNINFRANLDHELEMNKSFKDLRRYVDGYKG